MNTYFHKKNRITWVSGRCSIRDYNNGYQFLTYRKSKCHSSAVNPPPPGSDDTELATFRLTILGRKPATDKSREDDAGRGEGYREPKDNVPCAGVFLRRRCFCQQANGRSGYSLHFCAPTHWIYCILASNCQYLST